MAEQVLGQLKKTLEYRNGPKSSSTGEETGLLNAHAYSLRKLVLVERSKRCTNKIVHT